LSTAGISRNISKLREEYLTRELNDKIKIEIKDLGLSYLNVSLKDETKKGESNFKSDLGFKQPIKVNSTVLSEGEQRGLALACYLAEADLSPTKHGLVVDDPVSSLDHQRIELVAKRLVEEAAKGRQIIIFTHNILFYLEVEKRAAEMGVGLAQNTIYRHLDHGAGIVNASMVPYQARKVTERIDAIRNELAAMKAAGLDPQEDEYRKAVESICIDLRKAWERLVEEVLLNKSVERFSYRVKTQSLKGVVVEDDDYRQIHFAMEKLSNFTAHDEAAGKQGVLSTVDQLMEAVNELDNYRIEIKKRASGTEESRKKLEKPHKADFA
ncbi:MAG TPA: AAA family ATPase, partial [Rhodospirillales bacterium]|nr:AAA family ATPase [Rhodospirillales bacterium]